MTSIPDFYDPERIGTLFYPNKDAIAAAAHNAALSPADDDAETVHLLLVDMQIDFCHQQGSLYVPGAEEDVQRTIEFIFRNAERITKITCSLDSHVPQQIFSPNWWLDEEGAHPDPYTIISAEDVESGRWSPQVMPEWSREYVRQLEQQAKKQLIVWPYHVLIGSPGHALDPELWSAVAWHSLARGAEPQWLMKGRIPHTEHYSVLRPEIGVLDHPAAEANYGLVNELIAADRAYIAGEAESHCVLETVDDLAEEYQARGHSLANLYLLQDCMSAVVHPEVDFHAMAQARFEELAAQGLNLTTSEHKLA